MSLDRSDLRASDEPLSKTSARYDALDAYRAFAMAGGVLLHGAMAYTDPQIKLWPSDETQGSLLLTLLIFVMHAFRLQAFFLMAGFFAGLLIQKRGTRGFCRNRSLRIGAPLALACVTILPAIQAIFVWGYERRGYTAAQTIGTLSVDMPLYYGPIFEFFASGRAVSGFHWFHLWFLWYLAIMYLMWLPFEAAATRLVAASNRWRFRPVVTAMNNLSLPLWFVIPTACLAYPMRLWQIDSPMSLVPEWPILGYYYFFFLIGRWLYAFRTDLLETTRRYGWQYCLIGILLGLPLMLATQSVGPHDPERYRPAMEWPALLSYSTFTWLMVLGGLGVCQRWLDRPVGWVKWLADSGYWQYLVHVPPMVALQVLMSGWSIANGWKYAIVVVTTYAWLLVSYRYLVRRTWVGWLLNGRRMR